MGVKEWFVLTLVVSLGDFHKLDDYIHHYEPLNYDIAGFHNNHQRVKRSLEPHLYLKFKAYNRFFNLKLKKDDTIFSDTHMHRNSDGTESPIDTSFIYHGSLQDMPSSYAHIAVINGTARGFINIPGDTRYHIDPAAQYLHNPSYHSVIYAEKHMDLDPYKYRREAEKMAGSCALEQAREWMKKTVESATYKPNRAKRHAENRPHDLYSKESNIGVLKRVKRKNLADKNTCYLYLRSDPMMWKYVKEEKYKSQILTDARAKEEILAFFTSHVAAIKDIYSRTSFSTYDKNIIWEGVNFLVQRTTIMTISGEKCNNPSEQSAFCNENIDVSNFLNLNSLDKHDEFCLAYVFTHRDFIQGTLGLAWVGSSTRAAGGICEKYKDYPEAGSKVGKSLNTGIVTIVNYGKPVPSRVSHLTFAHEVGHNFGSPHDSGPECAPYGTTNPDASNGNYIMFASATMGDKKNNDYFSVCSKDNITRVLDAVNNEREGKINCFGKSNAAFCGNGLVEPGEECDCGYANDCTDTCCVAKGTNNSASECKLKPGKTCSPTAGPCCNESCNHISGVVCRNKDDCTSESKCNGLSESCPAPTKEPNNTLCNSYSQVCIDGECRGSVCLKIDWEECFLTASEDGNGPSREDLCFIACKKKSTGECISSKNTDLLSKPGNEDFLNLLTEIENKNTESTGKAVQLPAGSPCDNFRGYCDVFHRCRGVDAEGPLARLKNLIFNPQTLQTIKEWIEEYWWAVLLMAIGLVVVMGVFIKICAVHTPSSNPRKSAARKLTLPRRRNQGGGPQGNKPSRSAASNPQFDPPPPYTGPSTGGPPHGKGPRYNNGGKRGRRDLEMQNI
ncbi:hypothetical protein SNE40_007309 [Patella caerulea]|uniref:ADAM10 endopeptidase n=1 Tax=Patella caerulea TaxID=87958 RepID=A0AAN8K4D1_PATCE